VQASHHNIYFLQQHHDPQPPQHYQRQQRRQFAGHSKWSNIRHRKGAKDKVKAALLGKASIGIMVAAKQCAGDVNHWKLQSAIAHAKSLQLPKEKIEDAIARGMGSSNSNNNIGHNDMKYMRYDAMLTMGGTTKVACIITALSDNRNRTAASVRHVVTKEGCGELMATDSLSFMFQHVGQIVVRIVVVGGDPSPHLASVLGRSKDEEEEALLECALEAGATNVEPYDDDEYVEYHEGDGSSSSSSSPSSSSFTFLVTTVDTELFHVVTALREANPQYEVVRFEHRYIVQDPIHGGVELSPEGEDQLMAFLDKMDENEDVTHVYHNAM
jgi:transcriptional/translational regulatory protein YebC/TACO1